MKICLKKTVLSTLRPNMFTASTYQHHMYIFWHFLNISSADFIFSYRNLQSLVSIQKFQRVSYLFWVSLLVLAVQQEMPMSRLPFLLQNRLIFLVISRIACRRHRFLSRFRYTCLCEIWQQDEKHAFYLPGILKLASLFILSGKFIQILFKTQNLHN